MKPACRSDATAVQDVMTELLTRVLLPPGVPAPPFSPPPAPS